MKKTFYLLAILCVLTLILSACSKDNKDKMQGTWKADTITTKNDIGEKMTINGQTIKVSDNDTISEDDKLKYFNFKNKNNTKIRLYNDKKDSDTYDKDIPTIEGKLIFSDDKMTIKTKTNEKYEFIKE